MWSTMWWLSCWCQTSCNDSVDHERAACSKKYFRLTDRLRAFSINWGSLYIKVFLRYNKEVSRFINIIFRYIANFCFFWVWNSENSLLLKMLIMLQMRQSEKEKLLSQLNVHINYLWWLQQQDRALFWRVTIQKEKRKIRLKVSHVLHPHLIWSQIIFTTSIM